MNHPRAAVLTLLVIAAAAHFVSSTGESMPATVAAHFDGSGVADGFMPRDRYLRFMTILVAVLPLLAVVAAVGSALASSRSTTSAGSMPFGFAAGLAVFLAFVHWLVVRANAAQPPHLSGTTAYGGLGAFAIFVLVWATTLRKRVRSPD